MSSRIRVDALEPSGTVLLLVDFVNPLNFPGGQALAPSALSAATETARLRRRLSRDGVRCIYANDNYGRWTADFKASWQRCSRMAGIPGRMARTLAPRARDFAVIKPRHSAFYATPLDILLQQLQCKRLVVTGLAADSCVLFTAMDAYLRGYAVSVPADCVAAESGEARDAALAQMARVLKADIRPGAELKAGAR